MNELFLQEPVEQLDGDRDLNGLVGNRLFFAIGVKIGFHSERLVRSTRPGLSRQILLDQHVLLRFDCGV